MVGASPGKNDATQADFEEALRRWIAEATIPQVIRALEIVKEELRRRNLVLEYDLRYEVPER